MLASSKKLVEGIMDCTSALVETVNYDIKAGIFEHLERLAGSENIQLIEKICEEQEHCEAFYDFVIEGEENINRTKPEVVISLFDYSIDKKEEDHVTEASEDGTVQSVILHELNIFDDWD